MLVSFSLLSATGSLTDDNTCRKIDLDWYFIISISNRYLYSVIQSCEDKESSFYSLRIPERCLLSVKKLRCRQEVKSIWLFGYKIQISTRIERTRSDTHWCDDNVRCLSRKTIKPVLGERGSNDAAAAKEEAECAETSTAYYKNTYYSPSVVWTWNV